MQPNINNSLFFVNPIFDKCFLPYYLSEDIFVYGGHIAESFVFDIVKIKYIREQKLKRILKDE